MSASLERMHQLSLSLVVLGLTREVLMQRRRSVHAYCERAPRLGLG
jgi:hypothetical protein